MGDSPNPDIDGEIPLLIGKRDGGFIRKWQRT
jgi:hypothetical protein